MKKIMKMMVMAMVAVTMIAGLTACSSSDDDNTTPEKKEMTVRATISYDINSYIKEDKAVYPGVLCNPDFVKTTITYYDENNNEVTEEVKDSKFSKIITYKKFPVKTGYTINYELLDENNIDLSKDYRLICQKNTPEIYIMEGEKVLDHILPGSSTQSFYTAPNQYTKVKDFKDIFKKYLPTTSVYYTIQSDGSYVKGRN